MLEEHEAFKDLPEVLQEIVKSKFTHKDEYEKFLNPDYDRDLHDPFLFSDMEKAILRIVDAIERNEKIAIYSDFDADGIPGGIILKETFEKIGYTNFLNYIPHRDKEGYGLHKKAIEKLAKEGVSLMITVDLGISAYEASLFAKELGVDLIITDHHEPGSNLPESFAAINPKLDRNYPFKELCGASVAFKLSTALIYAAKEKNILNAGNIKDGWEKWFLDLLAISTIGDVMPLVGENRAIVYWGLYVLKKTKRSGIKRFFKDARVSINLLEESDIAFSLIPKINVASRLGDPYLAFKLLSSKDVDEIDKIILELNRLNKLRQSEVAKISKEAKRRFIARSFDGKVFVTGDKSWNPALLGLSAGKIADEFGITVCLWGQDSSGVFKGSCRSANGVSVHEMFECAKEDLLEFGGHKSAGGFSIEFDKLLEIESIFNSASKESEIAEKSTQTLSLKSSDINWDFYKKLRRLAPFGLGNEAPLFEFSNIKVLRKRVFGKHNEHLELTFKHDGHKEAKAISFFAPNAWSKKEKIKTIYGKIEQSNFAGRVDLRVKIEALE